MKVKKCTTCENCQSRRMVSSYKPANYHEVGMAHYYAFCKKAQKRCLEVKSKECCFWPKGERE